MPPLVENQHILGGQRMFVSVVSMSGTSGKHVTHWQGWLCLEFLLL